jgi:phage terminase large subunit GpA-like protein
LALVACGVWYLSGTTERSYQSEVAEDLKGIKYRLKCIACGATSEMDAPVYVEELTPEGVRCPKCGQIKALQVGSADAPDPSEFDEEMKALVTVSDAQQAANAVQEELNRVQRAIDAAEGSSDADGLAKLNAEKAKIQAKSIAVYARWEEIRQGK